MTSLPICLSFSIFLSVSLSLSLCVSLSLPTLQVCLCFCLFSPSLCLSPSVCLTIDKLWFQGSNQLTYKVEYEDEDQVDNSCCGWGDHAGIFIQQRVVLHVEGRENSCAVEDHTYKHCHCHCDLQQTVQHHIPEALMAWPASTLKKIGNDSPQSIQGASHLPWTAGWQQRWCRQETASSRMDMYGSSIWTRWQEFLLQNSCMARPNCQTHDTELVSWIQDMDGAYMAGDWIRFIMEDVNTDPCDFVSPRVFGIRQPDQVFWPGRFLQWNTTRRAFHVSHRSLAVLQIHISSWASKPRQTARDVPLASPIPLPLQSPSGSTGTGSQPALVSKTPETGLLQQERKKNGSKHKQKAMTKDTLHLSSPAPNGLSSSSWSMCPPCKHSPHSDMKTAKRTVAGLSNMWLASMWAHIAA